MAVIAGSRPYIESHDIGGNGCVANGDAPGGALGTDGREVGYGGT